MIMRPPQQGHGGRCSAAALAIRSGSSRAAGGSITGTQEDDKARLALPPARGFAVLTCMDARLDPAKYAGLAKGDAHVIRNDGGRQRRRM
jgi:carbonic anhydrase